ncbi:MAG: hypothetical protein J5985_01285 [Kiritimatiellae bacterium]|nr:hypothetical protein [Kiritimatiellia bacterium]
MSLTMTDEVWAFDCEWIPDVRAGRLVYGLPDDCPDEEVMRVMWQEGGATKETPQPFLKTIYSRVVSIAALIRRRCKDGKVKLFLLALPENPDDPSQDERYVLRRFLNDGVASKNPQLIGFNSRNADFRILLQRSFVNGLAEPELLERMNRKPWDNSDADLMDTLAGFGKSYACSLNDAARLSGIPGKLDMTGYDVCGAWYGGKRKEVIEYNCFDALTTYLVWLRLMFFAGKLSQEDHKQEQDRVREFLKEEIRAGKEFLNTYMEAWDDLQRRIG